MKTLSQAEAVAVDDDLMVTPGFSVDQLTELAGLSVAAAVEKHYPDLRRVLCVCGPGNNGGDGLVAARHLKQFGYSPAVVFPKRPQMPLFVNLATQMEMMRIPLLSEMPAPDVLVEEYDVVLDGVFGFSFGGAVRAPFDNILRAMRVSPLPSVAIDIPSGWDVEKGPRDADALQPNVLVSLTAPKQGSTHFRGEAHYLGGRFVPPGIFEKYGFEQPTFPGTEQVVRLDE